MILQMSPMFYLLFYLRMTQTNDLVNTMNNEMAKAFDWLRDNKLSLNIDKTHFVLFRRQRKLANLTQSFIVSGQLIAQVKSTKFLGIIIDESFQ